MRPPAMGLMEEVAWIKSNPTTRRFRAIRNPSTARLVWPAISAFSIAGPVRVTPTARRHFSLANCLSGATIA